MPFAPKRFSFSIRSTSLLWLALGLAVNRSRALVRFNDGTDQVYVSGTYSIGHSSNLSSSSTGTGDYSYGASAAIECHQVAREIRERLQGPVVFLKHGIGHFGVAGVLGGEIGHYRCACRLRLVRRGKPPRRRVSRNIHDPCRGRGRQARIGRLRWLYTRHSEHDQSCRRCGRNLAWHCIKLRNCIGVGETVRPSLG